MQLHELKLGRGRKRKKRIGRGGKRGTTSGRGTKGQRSRAGHRIRPALRDLLLRLPKRRGFRNKPVRPKPFTIDLERLLHKAKPLLEKEALVVDRSFLVQIGLLPASFRGEIKVIGKGVASFPLTLKGLKVSEGAKMSIEKAGGKVLGFAQKSEPQRE